MNESAPLLDQIVRDVVDDLVTAYCRSFDSKRVRDNVMAYYWPSLPTETPSEEERRALVRGAALALLGSDYRPPGPDSDYPALIKPEVAFDTILSLARIAQLHVENAGQPANQDQISDALTSLIAWVQPTANACVLDPVDPVIRAFSDETSEPFDVMIDANLATQSADILRRPPMRSSRVTSPTTARSPSGLPPWSAAPIFAPR